MNTKNGTYPRVDDIIGIMEAIAPPQLAETWDNCGLQVGHRNWPVRKIWIALDPLPEVIHAAGQSQVDMVITHHPLIFKPLDCIDVETAEGEIIASAIEHHTAIYTAHTNLDSTHGGINDVLAHKIGLSQLIPLVPSDDFETEDQHADPVGIGRIGILDPPIGLDQLVRKIKAGFRIEKIKVAGQSLDLIDSVAVCSGSGGSLLGAFLNSDASVYISGDLKYHDARVVESAGRVLIDIGHFASEHLIIEPLVARMASAMQHSGWQVEVEPCSIEQDPFALV